MTPLGSGRCRSQSKSPYVKTHEAATYPADSSQGSRDPSTRQSKANSGMAMNAPSSQNRAKKVPSQARAENQTACEDVHRQIGP